MDCHLVHNRIEIASISSIMIDNEHDQAECPTNDQVESSRGRKRINERHSKKKLISLWCINNCINFSHDNVSISIADNAITTDDGQVERLSVF